MYSHSPKVREIEKSERIVERIVAGFRFRSCWRFDCGKEGDGIFAVVVGSVPGDGMGLALIGDVVEDVRRGIDVEIDAIRR